SDPNLQFGDFTVGQGQVVTVASGTVIRCLGAFTNQGTIQVETHALGSMFNTLGNAVPYITFGNPGLSLRPPGMGIAASSNASAAIGGIGAPGVSRSVARSVLRPGPIGGGGGGGSDSALGGSGGGTLTILCRGAITNGGTIEANGTGGSGIGRGG